MGQHRTPFGCFSLQAEGARDPGCYWTTREKKAVLINLTELLSCNCLLNLSADYPAQWKKGEELPGRPIFLSTVLCIVSHLSAE